MHVVSVNDMKKMYSILLVYHWKYGISSDAREERSFPFSMRINLVHNVVYKKVYINIWQL